VKRSTYDWAPERPVNAVSETVTSGIRVRVQSFYVPEQSSPSLQTYIYAYRIRISNEGNRWAQLVSRYWIVTDGNGQVQQVRGSGVVGEQPTLEPGHAFEYTSACPLSTRIGFMRGSYQMLREDGSKFSARVDEFGLISLGMAN